MPKLQKIKGGIANMPIWNMPQESIIIRE